MIYSVITSYPFISKHGLYSFSYIPLYLPQYLLDEYGIQGKAGIQTFEDIIKTVSNIIPALLGIEINLSMDGITEITEEEYYKID